MPEPDLPESSQTPVNLRANPTTPTQALDSCCPPLSLPCPCVGRGSSTPRVGSRAVVLHPEPHRPEDRSWVLGLLHRFVAQCRSRAERNASRANFMPAARRERKHASSSGELLRESPMKPQQASPPERDPSGRKQRVTFSRLLAHPLHVLFFKHVVRGSVVRGR